MIKVSVLYPNNEGSKFDMSYYCNSHIPMVQEKLGKVCKGVAVEQGVPARRRDHGRRLLRWDISISTRWANSNPLSGLMRTPSWRTFPDTPTSNRPFRSAKSRSSLVGKIAVCSRHHRA